MNNEMETLRMLRQRYQNMPYTPQRAAVNQEYVQLADRLALSRAQVRGRYDLAWAYAVGDDPAKALPVCAEFFSLWEAYPETMDGRVEGPSAAMIAHFVAVSLPQVPLEECKKLLEQFRLQVKKAGVGERLWQMHAWDFCVMTGDMEGAQAHYDKFRATPRDDISDCAACEASNAAESLLKMGRREDALAEVRPVLSGALVCESQPWSVLSTLIHDALDQGDLSRAVAYGRHLARHELKSPSDLVCAGALLRLDAFTAPERGKALLERCLPWSAGMWDQNVLFRFYLGVWAFFARLGRTEEQTALRLPAQFPLYREDGVYSCEALAAWFYDAAAEIACRFDARNGYPGYRKTLDAAEHSVRNGEHEG